MGLGSGCGGWWPRLEDTVGRSLGCFFPGGLTASTALKVRRRESLALLWLCPSFRMSREWVSPTPLLLLLLLTHFPCFQAVHTCLPIPAVPAPSLPSRCLLQGPKHFWVEQQPKMNSRRTSLGWGSVFARSACSGSAGSV